MDKVVLAIIGELEGIEASLGLGLGYARRKPMELMGVSIEVPSRNESFRDESNSSASQIGFKSPLSHMSSLKRTLNRDKRVNASPT